MWIFEWFFSVKGGEVLAFHIGFGLVFGAANARFRNLASGDQVFGLRVSGIDSAHRVLYREYANLLMSTSFRNSEMSPGAPIR